MSLINVVCQFLDKCANYLYASINMDQPKSKRKELEKRGELIEKLSKDISRSPVKYFGEALDTHRYENYMDDLDKLKDRYSEINT